MFNWLVATAVVLWWLCSMGRAAERGACGNVTLSCENYVHSSYFLLYVMF